MKKEIAEILKSGGVGILPTDTLYGLVGSALSKKAVLRIYKLRRRNSKKPLIILISSLADLKLFNIRVDNLTMKQLRHFWPGKVSIVLDCPHKKFSYLHRGTKTLAFRLPAKKSLVNLLKKTGPLVAPSANLEGKPPAKTIKQAKKYFGEKVDPVRNSISNGVDFYLDRGKLSGRASTLIKIKNNRVIVLRKGVGKIN